MAPRGPRAQAAQPGRETKSTTLNSKPMARGGIQKRKAPAVRTDNDGDLDMGSGARRSGRAATTASAPRGAGGRSAPSRGGSRVAQAVQKHLKNGDMDLESRVGTGKKPRVANAPNLTYLRVHGLKESKASANSDGGLSDLLAFLERKASSFTSGRQKRQIKIKKVSLLTADRYGSRRLVGDSSLTTSSLWKPRLLDVLCAKTRRPNLRFEC